MSYLKNLLVSLDQFGNVIAGGNPDNTVSARVGKYNEDRRKGESVGWYWSVFEFIIDWAFYPVDNFGHCREAFYSDIGEMFDTRTNGWVFIIIQFLFIIPVCLFITFFTYLAWTLGFVSPKEIDRNKEMSERLLLTHAKLKGMEHELQVHSPKLEESIAVQASAVVDLAQSVKDLVDKNVKKSDD